MTDPSFSSGQMGPQAPKPEFTQHMHHHTLFHPRAQMHGPHGPIVYSTGYGHWHGGQHFRRFRGPSRLFWLALGAGTTAFYYSRSQAHSPDTTYRHNWACRTGASQNISYPAVSTPPTSSLAAADARSAASKTEPIDRERAIAREFDSPSATSQDLRAQNLERITSALEGLDDRHLEKMSKLIKRFQ